MDLDNLKLGLNDLLPVAHDWDGSLDEFRESLEHVLFYLRSPEAFGIQNPKAWLLKQLRAGYYGAPANFVSWQDRQVEEKLRTRQQQSERRQQQRIQMLQADFDLWLADLTTDERQAIFEADGKLKPEFITLPMQRQMLKTRFAQLHGVPEFAPPDSQIEPRG